MTAPEELLSAAREFLANCSDKKIRIATRALLDIILEAPAEQPAPAKPMSMTAWLDESAHNCDISRDQLRVWIYRGYLPMPNRVVKSPRVIEVTDPPLTQLPESLMLRNGRRVYK